MEIEPGQPIDGVLLADIEWDSRLTISTSSSAGKRRTAHQDGADIEAAGLEQPPDHKPSLGDKQPMLQQPLRITHMDVVGNARIVQVET